MPRKLGNRLLSYVQRFLLVMSPAHQPIEKHMGFWKQLFSSGNFDPHGYCYLWNPGLVWLHAISDSLIAAAYFAIPVVLLLFIRKRRDLPSSWMFALLGAVYRRVRLYAPDGGMESVARELLAGGRDQGNHRGGGGADSHTAGALDAAGA
jgi:hypothetical protein